MEQKKVVIVGAGPAGTTCGILLRRKNIDCVIIDRAVFPRDKICGGGLTPRSYKLLMRMMPDFCYEYNSVRRLKLCIEGEQVLDFLMDEEIRIVKRRDFDAQLLARYQNDGGDFLNDALTDVEEQGDKVIGTLKSGKQIICDYLVGADGANSKVRRYLNPNANHGILCMEQYAPKGEEDAIVGNLSRFYRQGYYYSFPNKSYDVQGFGDYMTTPQGFRMVLKQMGCPDLKALGAYIPQKINYPLRKNIILIGDAGGFPNRLTFEGLYYAFLTAGNAALTISSGMPFSVTNKKVFDNKKMEEYAARVFYSGAGLMMLKYLCRLVPGVVTWAFNKAASKY